jgi:hypothetical protein
MGNTHDTKTLPTQSSSTLQSVPSFLESRVVVKCINCSTYMVQNNKKRQSFIRCLSGHAVCLNCWHEYISEILDQRSPVIQCCASVSPKCCSEYNLHTLINLLSLEEYKSFVRKFGEREKNSFSRLLLNVVPSFFSQKQKSATKSDFNVILPYVYPKTWFGIDCVYDIFFFFFFFKERCCCSSLPGRCVVQPKRQEDGGRVHLLHLRRGGARSFNSRVLWCF